MKKLKLNLVLIALCLGLTGAFAFKPAHHRSTAKDNNDYWFDPSGSTYTGNQDFASGEATRSGCDGDDMQPVCQSGYTDGQLNVSGNPSDGVKSTQKASPDEQIFVHKD